MIYRENLNMTFHVGRNREIEFPPQDAGLDRISTECNKQTEGGVIEKGNGPTMKFPPYSEKLTGFGRLKEKQVLGSPSWLTVPTRLPRGGSTVYLFDPLLKFKLCFIYKL